MRLLCPKDSISVPHKMCKPHLPAGSSCAHKAYIPCKKTAKHHNCAAILSVRTMGYLAVSSRGVTLCAALLYADPLYKPSDPVLRLLPACAAACKPSKFPWDDDFAQLCCDVGCAPASALHGGFSNVAESLNHAMEFCWSLCVKDLPLFRCTECA